MARTRAKKSGARGGTVPGVKYQFRAEATDGSGHFRDGGLAAASEEEARGRLEAIEARIVGYRLTTEELEAMRAKYADRSVDFSVETLLEQGWRGVRDATGVVMDPGDRSRVEAHRQTEPYEIVLLEEA